MSESGLGLGDIAQREYKYDVAFSFTVEDEALATAINDLLQDRYSTFLYSERQAEIAGTDGEASFSKAFREESRIVVVFYRAKWGQTKWTRIEETAVRNRAFDEGYDFVTFIPVEPNPVLPVWMPKPRLWVNLERWGIEGAVSVIEARLQEAGGSQRVESVVDHVARLKRRSEAEEQRKAFLGSMDGVHAATEESQAVFGAIGDMVAKIRQEVGVALAAKLVDKGIEITADRGFLAVDWHMQYGNSLEYSHLSVELWEADPRRRLAPEPQILHRMKYRFDRDISGLSGWRQSDGDRLVSSQHLADECLRMLIEYGTTSPDRDHDDRYEDDEGVWEGPPY